MEPKLIESVIRRQRRRALGDMIACTLFPVALALTSGLLLAL